MYPREVAVRALQYRAAAVILAHNHPSGRLEVSKEDLLVTEQLRDAGRIMGIPVLDHLFVRDLVPGSRGVVEGATASDHYPIWAVFDFVE